MTPQTDEIINEVSKGVYTSRSEFVRDAIRSYVKSDFEEVWTNTRTVVWKRSSGIYGGEREPFILRVQTLF